MASKSEQGIPSGVGANGIVEQEFFGIKLQTKVLELKNPVTLSGIVAETTPQGILVSEADNPDFAELIEAGKWLDLPFAEVLGKMVYGLRFYNLSPTAMAFESAIESDVDAVKIQ